MSDEKSDIKELNKEIASLKTKLKEVNDDKEKWFKEKEELKKEMHVLIDKIKNVQKTNDPSEVEKLKKERDTYNSEVRHLIEKINELKQEKLVFLKKHGVKEDPENIKKNIEKIEEKIETEVLSIDRERKLMEYIRKMKKDYESLGDVKLIDEKISEISKQIEDTKKKANDAHEKFKLALKEKKKWYKEFFSLSKQINVIKKQQEKAFEMFISLKNSFLEVSKQLSVKLHLAKKEKEKVVETKQIKRKSKEEIENKIVEEKQKKVEEKLKKGGKLTTEDLIVMQGNKEDEPEQPE